jgi:hypothetical protein
MTSKPYSSKQCRSLIITCRTHSRAGACAGVSCCPRSINYRLSHLCLVFLHHVHSHGQCSKACLQILYTLQFHNYSTDQHSPGTASSPMRAMHSCHSPAALP